MIEQNLDKNELFDLQVYLLLAIKKRREKGNAVKISLMPRDKQSSRSCSAWMVVIENMVSMYEILKIYFNWIYLKTG